MKGSERKIVNGQIFEKVETLGPYLSFFFPQQVGPSPAKKKKIQKSDEEKMEDFLDKARILENAFLQVETNTEWNLESRSGNDCLNDFFCSRNGFTFTVKNPS